MRKPYLITSLNEMPGKDRWIRTLQRAMGDSVQPVIIMWRPYFGAPPHWIVRQMDRPYPGHLAKLLPLLDMDLDRDRWFIFTDGADVLFQAPLPKLDAAGHRILLANEGLLHGECDFWRPHLELPRFGGLRDKPVYNVGSWAAIGHLFLDFVRYLHLNTQDCRRDGSPLVDCHEQLVYNHWVQANLTDCGEVETLFCTLYANFIGPHLDGRGRVRRLGGRFVTSRGDPYAIVHGNGSTKALLEEGPAPAGAGFRTGE
jgi:hypothetical protein